MPRGQRPPARRPASRRAGRTTGSPVHQAGAWPGPPGAQCPQLMGETAAAPVGSPAATRQAPLPDGNTCRRRRFGEDSTVKVSRGDTPIGSLGCGPRPERRALTADGAAVPACHCGTAQTDQTGRRIRIVAPLGDHRWQDAIGDSLVLMTRTTAEPGRTGPDAAATRPRGGIAHHDGRPGQRLVRLGQPGGSRGARKRSAAPA